MSTVWKQSTQLAAVQLRAVFPVAKRQREGSVVATLELPPAYAGPSAGRQATATTKAKPPAAPSTAPGGERRGCVRAKVNCFACVRSMMFGSDVVVCMGMSRGGVSFKSKNRYALGAAVQIAVPFPPETPEAPAIFVAGKIVNVSEFPDGKLFRCGLAFLPT